MPRPKKTKFTYDYARPALTVDVVLVTLEAEPRVLLIQRKRAPFARMWALPGGFVNENEKLVDAAKRELQEETGVEVTDLEQLYTAGNPNRDPRGWTVSVVYLARVNPTELTPIAADDAKAVAWHPLAKLPLLAFDHAMLIARAEARLVDRGE
jgi:8-oxo-dGTP diphosphatase